jgi:S1-C subfamily serine protease
MGFSPCRVLLKFETKFFCGLFIAQPNPSHLGSEPIPAWGMRPSAYMPHCDSSGNRCGRIQMPGLLVDFSNELADAVERAGASVISVPDGGREGVSGTIWRDGVAVVVEHTIRDMDEVAVVLPSGESVKGTVAGRDYGTDIAVLKIPASGASAVIADEANARVGEIVLSVGRRKDEGLAATYGLISAIGGPWRTGQGARIDRWFRLDLNPFPGFSGGPVVNVRGEAIGMATSGPRRSAATIPASTVNRVVDQLLQHGRIARGYLGIGIQPVAFPEGAARDLGVEGGRGLLGVMLEPNGPAANAGVLLGDIVVRVDGSELRGAHSLQSGLDSEKVGHPVAVDVVRGGKIVSLNVVVGEKPAR